MLPTLKIRLGFVASLLCLLSAPLYAQEPSHGADGFFSVGLGPSIANFFDRLLLSGTLQAQGGGMLSDKLGLGGQLHIEAGQLDARYLSVGSTRLSFVVLGVLSERVTMSGAFGGGVIGYARNTNGSVMLSSLLAADFTVGIDLTRPCGPTGSRFYLPIVTSVVFFPQVRDGLMLSMAISAGLGYRYR